MSTIQELQNQVVKFRDERDWKQFHSAKDMLLSLLLEASELAEHSQWKNETQFAEYLQKSRAEVAQELADVFYWILLISHDFEIDLVKAFNEKLEINRKKYPIEQARGNAAKYSTLK